VSAELTERHPPVNERSGRRPAVNDRAARIEPKPDPLRERRLRALGLMTFAAVMEVLLILPFVDHLADAHPMIHFTQHGFIFLGGVLMGIALRDAYLLSR
jgi:hypothetical protein